MNVALCVGQPGFKIKPDAGYFSWNLASDRFSHLCVYIYIF